MCFCSLPVASGRYQYVSYTLKSTKSSTLDLGLLDFGASYTIFLSKVRLLPVPVYWKVFAHESISELHICVCVCVSGKQYHCASQDGRRESKQRAYCLADPSVRPNNCGRGPVLHHWLGVLLLTGINRQRHHEYT